MENQEQSYYQLNREKVLQRQKEKYAANRDLYNDRAKNYYHQNKERKHAYYIANREVKKQKASAYYHQKVRSVPQESVETTEIQENPESQ